MLFIKTVSSQFFLTYHSYRFVLIKLICVKKFDCFQYTSNILLKSFFSLNNQKLVYKLLFVCIHHLLFCPKKRFLQKLIIRGAQLSDGGKYTCKAKNEAGSSEVDIQLKVLVPPKIDKSNVIQNPLGKAGRFSS